MVSVVYVVPGGDEWRVEARPGETVMSAAVRRGVPGIVGECGGNNSCATCHVWVRPEFADRAGPPGDLEDDILDLAVEDRREGSRLGCQIPLGPEVDGLVVEVPPGRS